MPPTKIEEIEEKINRVLFYLHNDNNTGKKGLVQDIQDIKTDMGQFKITFTDFRNQYEQKEAIKNAKIVWITGIVTAALNGLGWGIKYMFFK